MRGSNMMIIGAFAPRARAQSIRGRSSSSSPAWRTSLFLLVATVMLAPFATAQSMPWILMSGQSNMEGHPHQAGESYAQQEGGQAQSIESIVRILTRPVNREFVRRDLIRECLKAQDDPSVFVVNEEIAEREADLLLSYDPNIYGNMMDPVDQIYCTWDFPTDYNGTLQVSSNVAPYAGCGGPWGPELMMAHTLKKTYGLYDSFGMAKVADGGTTIGQWNDQSDIYWTTLFDRLEDMESIHDDCRTGDCPIKAFVWFQGSQDTFDDGDPYNYESNLRALVDKVRNEIFRINPPGTHEKPSDIPVVIMGIGCWRSGSEMGKLVVGAQKAFCASDLNCEFVQTDDLMCFFHYDTASMLIMGQRAATAVHTLLTREAREPVVQTSLPTAMPSPRPSPSPSGTPEPSVLGFRLMNSISNEPMKVLLGGETIIMSETPHINIVAQTQGTVVSVRFTIDGLLVNTESFPPYALGQDNAGDLYDWIPFRYGPQQLTATIYDAAGEPGDSLSIQLNMLERPPPAPTPAPTQAPTAASTPEPPPEPMEPGSTHEPTLEPTPGPTPEPTSGSGTTEGVTGFTLVDSMANKDIADLGNGATIVLNETPDINIVARTQGAVASVEFFLDGILFNTEGVAPFALAGDFNQGDYYSWTPAVFGYQLLTAIAYDNNGVAINSLGISINVLKERSAPSPTPPQTDEPVVNNPSPTPLPTPVPAAEPTPQPTESTTASGVTITSFSLVDSASDFTLVDTLPSGTTIDLSVTPYINLVANTSGNPASVQFLLNGDVYQTESLAPFAIAGDRYGDFANWTPPSGTYIVTAIAFDQPGGAGNILASLTIQLKIVGVGARRQLRRATNPNA